MTPPPYMTPKAELGLNVYEVKVLPSRPRACLLPKVHTSPLAPPPLPPLWDPGAPQSQAGVERSGQFCSLGHSPFTAGGGCVEKSRKVCGEGGGTGVR